MPVQGAGLPVRTFLTSKRFGASVGALTSVISASDGVEGERPVSWRGRAILLHETVRLTGHPD